MPVGPHNERNRFLEGYKSHNFLAQEIQKIEIKQVGIPETSASDIKGLC